tara:strand:+ start:15783 stop:16220 length:438 start_codon:yes stop_codon:yes gene_type:complete
LTGPVKVFESLYATRFLRFLVAGGLAALVNFGSRFFYNIFVDFSAAVVLAFLSGLTVGYLLNKRYVFTASTNSVSQEIGWFVLINTLALAQTWGLSVYLVQLLPQFIAVDSPGRSDMVEALAHGAGIMLPVFTSYIGHKYLTFRE